MLSELSRRDWPRFFDRVAAALAGRAVDVYAAGLDGEPQEEWVRLASLSYDAEANALALVLDEARPVVRHPRHIYVHQDDHLLHSMELIHADGRRDFIVLRHPLEVLV